MKATTFKETNTVFGAGGNPNTSQIAACLANDPQSNNADCIITRFKLNDEEKERLIETGEISVVTMGNGLAPQFLTVFDPIKEHGLVPKEL